MSVSASPETALSKPPVKRSVGFTLVELLVVVLILSILMAVAMPLYLNAIQNSERNTARSNLHMLMNASASYRINKGTYPASVSDLIGNGELNVPPVGPGQTDYTIYTSGTLPDGRTVPTGGVAACANDASKGAFGDYGCFIPGDDTD
jgi:type II secretion system protein G